MEPVLHFPTTLLAITLQNAIIHHIEDNNYGKRSANNCNAIKYARHLRR